MTSLPFLRPAAAVAAGAALLANAAGGAWHFNFNQGVAEYAVDTFTGDRSHLALSCSEAGIRPGTVGVDLHRAGFAPAAATPATFTTERGSVTVLLDKDGWRSFPSLAAAPSFGRLWHLLATSRTLRVSYGPGRPVAFSLSGARALLGREVCPRQLAR